MCIRDRSQQTNRSGHREFESRPSHHITDSEAHMSWRVCSTPGCSNLIETPARKCDACTRAQQDRTRTRGRNPYNTRGHQSFRRQVLARDPYCVCPGNPEHGGCGKHKGLCGKPSTIADHYPYERIELIDMHLNPNDPQFGRGLCKHCLLYTSPSPRDS